MSILELLDDGLLDELKDLYSAESQILKALPKMLEKASNPKLKEIFASHLEETHGQVKRLDEISAILKQPLTGKTCQAMKGLLEEGREILEKESENEGLIDALLIGAARRVEHYEMAAYCTTRAMADELGNEKVMKLLSETFDEESNADDSLSGILKEEILPEAHSFKDGEAKSHIPSHNSPKIDKNVQASKR